MGEAPECSRTRVRQIPATLEACPECLAPPLSPRASCEPQDPWCGDSPTRREPPSPVKA